MDAQTLKYGQIAYTARQLNYQLYETQSQEGYRFTWSDPLVGGGFHCPTMADKKDAFMAACDVLADSWVLTPKPDET